MTTSQPPQNAANPNDSSPQALPGDFVVRASIAVLAGTLLLRLAGGLALSSLQLYQKSLGADGGSIAWVAAGYYATELVLAPVFGALSDRYGRKIFLVLAPLLGAVALVLYPHASSVAVFFAIRVLEGVSAGGAIPATLGYLSDLTDGSKYRSRIMGLFEVMTLVGVAIGGTVLGPRVWDAFGTGSFAALAVLYVLGALVFALFLPQIGLRVQRRRTWSDYARALSNRRILRFMPAWFAATGVIGLWLVHVQSQLYQGKPGFPATPVPGQNLVASLDGPGISLVLGSFAVAFLAGLFFGSRPNAGRKSTVMLQAGAGLMTIAVCLFLLNHPELGLDWRVQLPIVGEARGWFLILLVGAFFQAGFTPVALAYLADISQDFPEDRGVVVGLYSIFLAGGNLIGGSLLGGPFVQALHMDGVALLTGLFTLVAFASVINIRQTSSD
jgi:MFS family permease